MDTITVQKHNYIFLYFMVNDNITLVSTNDYMCVDILAEAKTIY